ncbi:DNA-binding protein [Alkalispirochaeta sphaeroplastigenens]|uniref:Nucleoid-associated protein AU468_01495 n=1 Tax=Alkalispirochaeta sphaeroplastigenens TaxID=1187066 RepID=A0A2S4K0T8_9SPIO|nr:YbaB/EbfC family nucleoid-associated protein [Alkalispirochaeta sphaeroplastigenens]POR05377.1 DNA-binding protein [Alkalispirochaeta sphaeroplastigenens]
MNPMDMFKNMGQLQEKMLEAQTRMRSITATGSAGGDMVTISMNGEFQIQQVTISPEAVDVEDLSLLQDLVRAAHNDAVAGVKEGLREGFSDMAGGLPFSPDLFGGGA